MTDKLFIDELAIRCDDLSFKDFNKVEYEKILNRAKREIARKYRILTKIYTFQYRNDDNTEYEPIELEIPGFLAEFRVKVNKKIYERSENKKLETDTYWLEFINNKILFDYYPRSKNDLILIYYTGEFNEEELEIEGIKSILPEQYDEEIIEYAMVELGRIGVTKFTDVNSERYKKYSNILQVYRKQPGIKSELVNSTEWKAIKPYTII